MGALTLKPSPKGLDLNPSTVAILFFSIPIYTLLEYSRLHFIFHYSNIIPSPKSLNLNPQAVVGGASSYLGAAGLRFSLCMLGTMMQEQVPSIRGQVLALSSAVVSSKRTQVDTGSFSAFT